MKEHWYLIIVRECVYCGAYKETRIRQYTPKPESIEDRYETHEYYDYCVEWGGMYG